MNRHLSISQQRRAFTLIELLIVIGIIALMMGLSLVVLGGLMDQADQEATSATIQKINRLLEQRIEAFDRAFKGARKDTAVNNMRILLADPNTDGDQSDGIFGVNDAVLEILAKKALFRFEFPQRFEERTLFGDPDTLVPGLPDSVYVAISGPVARTKLGLPDTTPLNDPAIIAQVATDFANHALQLHTESSELLYFFLTRSGNYGSAAVDGDRFTEREIADTDNDGLPEFIDAWGQPLRYYRWPTRLIDVDAPSPFEPDLANLSDPTDLAMDLNGDGTIDIGQRIITADERAVANLLLRGLPPGPFRLPNGALPRDLLMTDPDDPVGRLYSELERLDGTNGKPEFALEFNEAKYHTPDTFHAPLIVSAGPDLSLGLYEPNDTANLGNLAAYDFSLGYAGIIDAITDNITSRNKRSGGRP